MNKSIVTGSGHTTERTARIERFQSLQPGRYWRAREAVKSEHITKGMVLLLQSLRYAEDIPHTVILRPHPQLIGQTVEVPLDSNDERQGYRTRTLNEHRFLVEDFLRLFEYEPDAQRVRAEEVKAVQTKVTSLQSELLCVQADPLKLEHIAQEALERSRDTEAEGLESPADEGVLEPETHTRTGLPSIGASAEALSGLSEVSLSDALSSEITEEALNALGDAAQRQYELATLKANWIKDKTAEIAQTLQELAPYFEEQVAAALAQTEDTRVYVDTLKKGIESLDLYVGKEVQVQTIRTGKSAPESLPLTLVQKKLLMDEELALWADLNASFDFEDEALFFDSLKKHPGLVEQIFPTSRCVLLMAVTARHIDYQDPWINIAKNTENRKVFLLARDGENLYRIFSPVEEHLGSARLFPSADEQDAIFKGLDGSTIKFKDVAYTDKLSLHEKHALHYKRFLILLAGLDHRLKLFGRFYPNEASSSFVSMGFQQKYLNFIFDEGSHVLGEQRPSLKEWLREKNSYLRSGSRVLCLWRNLMNQDTAPGSGSLSGYGRYGRNFIQYYSPKNDFDVCQVQSSAGELIVSVAVFGHSAASGKQRQFNCKVNLSKFNEDYAQAMAFLCLDAVTPDEIAWYLNNRQSRADHLYYIRFFKRALQVLEKDRQAQALSRKALHGILSALGESNEREVNRLIDKAVIAWQSAHPNTALPSPEDRESGPWEALTAQLKTLFQGDATLIKEVERLCAQNGVSPLRLVLCGDGKRVCYAAPAPEDEDNRLLAHAWVYRIEVKSGKTGTSFKGRRWVYFNQYVAAETTLKEWSGAKDWFNRTTLFKSPSDKAKRLDFVKEYEHKLPKLGTTLTDELFEEYFTAWKSVRNEATLNSKIVVNPQFAVALAATYSKERDTVEYLCVRVEHAHALLYRMASGKAQKAQLEAAYCAAYRHKDAAKERFELQVRQDIDFELYAIGLELDKTYDHGFFASTKTLTERRLTSNIGADPRIAAKMQELETDSRGLTFWFPQDKATVISRADKALALELPDNYAPCKLIHVRLFEPKEGQALPYSDWFDLVDMSLNAMEYSPIEGHAYSPETFILANPEQARVKMATILKDEYTENVVLKSAEECDEAPKAPEEVTARWFVIKNE